MNVSIRKIIRDVIQENFSQGTDVLSYICLGIFDGMWMKKYVNQSSIKYSRKWNKNIYSFDLIIPRDSELAAGSQKPEQMEQVLMDRFGGYESENSQTTYSVEDGENFIAHVNHQLVG